MINRNEAKNIIVALINETFAGYTVAVHEMKEIAQTVLETAMNGHINTTPAKVRNAFVSFVSEEYGINA